jgi:hypothetical protein
MFEEMLSRRSEFLGNNCLRRKRAFQACSTEQFSTDHQRPLADAIGDEKSLRDLYGEPISPYRIFMGCNRTMAA